MTFGELLHYQQRKSRMDRSAQSEVFDRCIIWRSHTVYQNIHALSAKMFVLNLKTYMNLAVGFPFRFFALQLASNKLRVALLFFIT